MILDLIAPALPALSVTVAPTVVLGGVALMIRPRGPVVAGHRPTTWGAVPLHVVLDRLDHERHTGELPTFSLVPYPEQWLAEDWQRAEVSA